MVLSVFFFLHRAILQWHHIFDSLFIEISFFKHFWFTLWLIKITEEPACSHFQGWQKIGWSDGGFQWADSKSLKIWCQGKSDLFRVTGVGELDLIEFKLARFWYNSDLILVYFLDNTDKTRGNHFGIQRLRYIYLTRGYYSEIWRNPWPIKARASLQSPE